MAPTVRLYQQHFGTNPIFVPTVRVRVKVCIDSRYKTERKESKRKGTIPLNNLSEITWCQSTWSRDNGSRSAPAPCSVKPKIRSAIESQTFFFPSSSFFSYSVTSAIGATAPTPTLTQRQKQCQAQSSQFLVSEMPIVVWPRTVKDKNPRNSNIDEPFATLLRMWGPRVKADLDSLSIIGWELVSRVVGTKSSAIGHSLIRSGC